MELDYAINDREPTITLIKTQILALQEKIIAYKKTVNNRYDLAGGPDALDPVNNVRIYENDGTVSCNTYCHGKNGQSWNNELPASWLGAQCLSAGANNDFGCTDLMGVNLQESDRSDSSQYECVCQRNDTFPYSSAESGDNIVPPNLYNFDTGESNVHQMTCGNDLTLTKIPIQCFKDLWANAGCTVPPVINKTGSFTLPGTSYIFDVAIGMLDMTKSGLNLGTLQQAILHVDPSTAVCMAKPSLSAMRDEIMTELDDLNNLITSIKKPEDDIYAAMDKNTATLLKQYTQLQTTFLALQADLQEPIKLDGSYEATSIQVTEKFSKYILVFLFTVFFIGALCFIFIKPDAGNLDMFMLGLAIIIIVYYLYEYIQKRRRM
jgi:hypothetical protein